MDNVNVSTTGQVTFIHKRHVLFMLQSFLVTSFFVSFRVTEGRGHCKFFFYCM